jgi:hypothetical protein
MGFGGQCLLLVSCLELVVVATHAWRVSDGQASRQRLAFTGRVFDPLVRAWPTAGSTQP